jgi:hypothetical protein
MTFNSRLSRTDAGEKPMNTNEARWEIIRALLEGFPLLKKKTFEYLKDQ